MLILWLSAALASSAPSSDNGPPPGGPHGHHGPPPPELIVERAAELGFDDETVAALRATLDAVADELDTARDGVGAAHQALRSAMTADQPDRAQVMAASRALGQAETVARELHLGLELDLRALLTSEQWEQLRPPAPPERGPGPRR